jgi:8-oxo-dGTP pyrophosphatase MutT (NUDIX family)
MTSNRQSFPRRRGPWQVLGTKEVYRNPWVRIREDQVVRPNGTRGIYGVVECPLALAIVALTEHREVFLVGQYRYTTGEYSWEIPTGSAAEGEDALASAQRELKEEAGLLAASWTSLGPVQISNSVTDQVGHVYLARGITRGEASPDETEELAVRLVSLGEAVRDAVSGRISQAFSVVGLLRAWHWLHQEGDRHSMIR